MPFGGLLDPLVSGLSQSLERRAAYRSGGTSGSLRKDYYNLLLVAATFFVVYVIAWAIGKLYNLRQLEAGRPSVVADEQP